MRKALTLLAFLLLPALAFAQQSWNPFRPAWTFISGIKTLTAATPTAVIRVKVAPLSMAGGQVVYTVYARDATDMVSRSGTIQFQVVNKASTETCTIAAARDQETEDGSSIAASSGSTLTYTWATDVSTPTDGCDLTLDAASGLTETVLSISYTAYLNASGSSSLTRQ